MAAPSRYASPEVQLLALAQDARLRGDSFEEFWRRAVREDQPNVLTSTPDPPPDCVRWPSDSTDRITWQRAIYESCAGWRRAYERWPALGSELAITNLAPMLARLRRAAASGIEDAAVVA